MKKCSRCGVEKPLEEFHRRKASKDGRETKCKACRAVYYQENKDVYADRDKKWREANPERAAEIRRKARKKAEEDGYPKRWREKNPEKWREYGRRNDKPEKRAARRARFRMNNPGYFTEQRELRESSEFTEDQLAIRDSGRCGICNEPLYEPIEIDHIVPLSRGGHHAIDNCQLAHRSCNRQKANKMPDECGAIRPLAA